MSSSLNICRHCGQQRKQCGRGLCWTCHSKPEIRARYPVLRDGTSSHATTICAHCGRKRYLHGRGLCKPCLSDRLIREQYEQLARTRPDRDRKPDLDAIPPPPPTRCECGIPDGLCPKCEKREREEMARKAEKARRMQAEGFADVEVVEDDGEMD